MAPGRAVLVATSRFHHPAHAAKWVDPAIDGVERSVAATEERCASRRAPVRKINTCAEARSVGSRRTTRQYEITVHLTTPAMASSPVTRSVPSNVASY